MTGAPQTYAREPVLQGLNERVEVDRLPLDSSLPEYRLSQTVSIAPLTNIID
jgi:hypothetical protein